MFAELRKAKELATHYVNIEPHEQREFVKDAVQRLVLPFPTRSCVSIIDGGVIPCIRCWSRGWLERDMHTAEAPR